MEMRTLIPTANNYGWTTETLNEISERFVAHAGQCSLPVLDVGAGFGIASLAALAVGASVVANDLCAEHLAALSFSVPQESSHRLSTITARFPNQLQFSDGSLAAAHASNVLHFLPGDEIAAGLEALHRWLAPGGMVFVMASSPYIGNLQETIPVFEARKAAGEKWPGEIENVRSYSSHETLKWLPKFLHVFDSEILSARFVDAGFQVLTAKHFRRRGLPQNLFYDGRENVGIIASKRTDAA